jgi:signal peptidase
VHRVISVHDRAGGSGQDILTKGDNNYGDDKARALFTPIH